MSDTETTTDMTVELVPLLRALADPVRLHIFATCVRDGTYVCVPERLGIDHRLESTLAHHVRLLRESGVVTARADGPVVSLRVRRAHLESRFPGLTDALTNAADGADLLNSRLLKGN
ncbi:transcriptional regulator [Streptomyces sp. NPDC050095]|uniref:ArsR/SmtB family transcription factor n=1 Tax=unclassified Streptomyces TaxID=2593676 RepID=UPI003432C9E2